MSRRAELLLLYLRYLKKRQARETVPIPAIRRSPPASGHTNASNRCRWDQGRSHHRSPIAQRSLPPLFPWRRSRGRLRPALPRLPVAYRCRGARLRALFRLPARPSSASRDIPQSEILARHAPAWSPVGKTRRRLGSGIAIDAVYAHSCTRTILPPTVSFPQSRKSRGSALNFPDEGRAQVER